MKNYKLGACAVVLFYSGCGSVGHDQRHQDFQSPPEVRSLTIEELLRDLKRQEVILRGEEPRIYLKGEGWRFEA